MGQNRISEFTAGHEDIQCTAAASAMNIQSFNFWTAFDLILRSPGRLTETKVFRSGGPGSNFKVGFRRRPSDNSIDLSIFLKYSPHQRMLDF